jgi:hypothetical protein
MSRRRELLSNSIAQRFADTVGQAAARLKADMMIRSASIEAVIAAHMARFEAYVNEVIADEKKLYGRSITECYGLTWKRMEVLARGFGLTAEEAADLDFEEFMEHWRDHVDKSTQPYLAMVAAHEPLVETLRALIDSGDASMRKALKKPGEPESPAIAGNRVGDLSPEERAALIPELLAEWDIDDVATLLPPVRWDHDRVTIKSQITWIDIQSAAHVSLSLPIRQLEETEVDAFVAIFRLWTRERRAEHAKLAYRPSGFAQPIARGSDASRHLTAATKGGQYPGRAAWLDERLRERGWNRNDPNRYGGPDPKTIDRILKGEKVGEGVLDTLVEALNKSSKGQKVDLLSVPRD